jgi:hypothetical protein
MTRDEAPGTHAMRATAHSRGVSDRGTLWGTSWRRYARSIVLALALLRCTGGESDLTGTWTGTMTDSVAGIGALSLTITQTAAQLSGTWKSTFADPTNNTGGSLSGTIADASTALVLTAAQPQACSFTVAVKRDNADTSHFTGTYVAFGCTRTESGNLDVRR